MARCRVDTLVAGSLLGVAALGLQSACQDTGSPTSVLVNVVPGPGMTDPPHAFRVFARSGETFFFEDERLPETGTLHPVSDRDYGNIVLYVGDVRNTFALDLFAIRDGERRGRGRADVEVIAGAQSQATVTILPTWAWPDGGALLGLAPNGESCIDRSQCLSGACVDAVCCATDSCSPCEACNLPGKVGACSAVPAGEGDGLACAPEGERSCDGLGSCRASSGQRCLAAADCASGHCVHGVCCETACAGACLSCTQAGQEGKCVPLPAGKEDEACGPELRCDGVGGCGPACTLHSDCPTGQACVDGTCVTPKREGETCGHDDQCVSALCSDGRCCRQACGPCTACTGPDGVCAPLPVGWPDPRPEVGCQGLFACTGQGTCALAAGAACRQNEACASGHCVEGGCCDQACSGLCRTCEGGRCALIVNDVDPGACEGNFRCSAEGQCLRAQGQVCRVHNDCADGLCLKGRCAAKE
ncbi:MAG: hypothetical protein KA712_01335 [Myxococcales bacterium]|nr:hypothetical protein [Myxococcales bacterium]